MASLSTTAVTTTVDESISIEHLLLKHRSFINDLQKQVPAPLSSNGKPGDNFVKYDDLFYLRYALSHENDLKGAKEALAFTFKFRSSPEHCQRAELVSTHAMLNNDSTIVESKKWSVAGALGVGQDGQPNEHGVLKEHTGQGFVMCVRIAMCKREEMQNSQPFNELRRMQLLHREKSFQYVDRLTRETGLLCKQVMLLDFAGASMSSMRDSRTRSIQAEVSNISKHIYPQLVDKLAMVNAPSWLAVLLKAFRLILPKSTLEKIELFSTTDGLWESEWGKHRLKREKMPMFLGGYLPNEMLSPELLGQCLSATSLPQLTLKARAKQEISVDVTPTGFCDVEVLVSVLHRGLYFTIVFQPTSKSNESDKAVVLWKEGKIEAAVGPRLERMKVCGPGVLLLKFSNAHSMMREKTVMYRVNVVPTEAQEAQVVHAGRETKCF
jgi:hypothetical protein